jgi:hypothetical protein
MKLVIMYSSKSSRFVLRNILGRGKAFQEVNIWQQKKLKISLSMLSE